ncbi:hypothetical protein Acr_06g0009080 [Actinidia rufa]|uniref:Uncharacterized protein n=1 Tax=Actinidia rufa TaxID=165716 RepID=A0A7J0ER44_9ERIC|nr:hypothetical protein Acr_06g0009080 [Actinidia rufa]
MCAIAVSVSRRLTQPCPYGVTSSSASTVDVSIMVWGLSEAIVPSSGTEGLRARSVAAAGGDLHPSKTVEVRIMVETITEGVWSGGLVSGICWCLCSCAYVVMKTDSKLLLLIEVADKVGCDIFELGRMVNRVVQSLQLKLPEFDICMVKWYLMSGWRPVPVVAAAVLFFTAQLNEVDRIEDVAMELNVTVATSW